MSALPAVPPHLRKYVVEQDYGAYTARDQAVWRFVVSQGHARLCEVAHPAYAAGFEAAGISTERIPDLHTMGKRLADSGFDVVCVDGFIPPRAFQAFQARGILPVAADIRSAAHLTYTPAPDIVHEAAGHAPFLAHPTYAAFLRRIGAVSERAFESAHDRAIYRVIYLLSELKENPQATPEAIARAEAALLRLSRASTAVSEAARMARLYWWTVEYGLVGTETDYRLYGAGLLSSVGEAHFCRDPRVRKLPLSKHCVDVDYDITHAQPQLFVASDFDQLDAVLCDVEQTLSSARGGDLALAQALASGDVATVVLDTGFSVVGTVLDFDAGQVRFSGPAGIAEGAAMAARHTPRFEQYAVPLGALCDGTPLSAITRAQLDAHVADHALALTTSAGVTLRGRLCEVHTRTGFVYAVTLAECRITRGDTLLLAAEAPLPVLLAASVRTATPVIPEGFFGPTEFPQLKVPRPRELDVRERELSAMHEEIACGLHAGERLVALHARLRSAYPDEWLLRFSLLAALVADGARSGTLCAEIEQELRALELRYERREPIESALGRLLRTRG